jgi:hypothetical protein
VKDSRRETVLIGRLWESGYSECRFAGGRSNFVAVPGVAGATLRTAIRIQNLELKQSELAL